MHLDDALQVCGKSLKEIKGMSIPNKHLLANFGNNLLTEEMNYNVVEFGLVHEAQVRFLNIDQQRVCNSIVHLVATYPGKLFFINHYGGTGKHSFRRL